MSYTGAIQSKARELLQEGAVACVIGYEEGTRGRARPAFVQAPDDAVRLIWNQGCTHNLTTYLPERLKPGKKGEAARPVAVVVKPCDSRAVNVLLAENQFAREQVHVIGVVCPGIRQGAGFQGFSEEAGGEAGLLQARCRRCESRTPVLYDTLIGESVPPPAAPAGAGELDQLTALGPEERLDYWLEQFDRCLRCYACRQACPMCHCPTCLFERDDSLWLGMGIGLSEKRAFHLGRAYHLAGRCVGCDECERVCPVGIPISHLNRMLAREVENAFGYRAGLAAVPGPLATMLDRGEGKP
jgi:ferredoxin